MEKQIELIQKQLDKIVDNELVHLKGEIAAIHESMSSFNVKIEKVIVNQDWLMRFFWIIASSSIGGLIMGVLSFILKR